MFLEDDSATVQTVPIALPDVGPVARFMRRLIGWPNPFNTVTIAILREDHLMVIYREPDVHPDDWFIAEALMHRVAHPAAPPRRRPPLVHESLIRESIIREVNEWDIRQVTNAAAALADLIAKQD